ncbi:M20/M25/M40 family metallo-hydrolase [Eilatimonas milleporae]|uniref:Carboxypeptidase Q n=1 Tax=Eilatimonas milleporae TaxID=911205 RepID=A0A3M0C0N8_9PROT|nr:M20/M25/M40 family metallo-hydrolase [Eilatimonas milleporae]RMB02872.1 Zn-dependent M28 family amino/carboxypeptidase [Eilatimonas milleporae]
MRLFTVIAAAVLLATGGNADDQAAPDRTSLAETERQAALLRDRALEGSAAYAIVESLTTEVGPRLAGTPDEARARDWAVAKLRALGFDDVRVEPFEMTTWVRGLETGAIVSPYPQPLLLTALGNSGATGPDGITGTLVPFATLADFAEAPAESVAGKIVYVGHAMDKTQDGSSYGFFGNVRRRGPAMATAKGAAAILIRSIGTDSRRFPHTGGTRFNDGQTPIPAAAVSNPDADQIERIVALAADGGTPVTVSLTLTPRVAGTTLSGNVIVDLKGSERPDEIVITGGHLDSWDLGTGAVDDGAGVAITTAAVKLIRDAGLTPKRTIRLVLWGAEEVGLLGAQAYARAHADEIANHVTGSESDFGAERIWKLHTGPVSDEGRALTARIARLLAPLGIAPGPENATSGGPDLIPLNRAGMPVLRLVQDGTDYFDLHHTPDDTLDKIDPAVLDQNVAAYAVLLWMVANSDVDFRRTGTGADG